MPLLNDAQHGARKAGKIARPEFKKILVDRMTFLGRYRVPKQELPYISKSRIVIIANDITALGDRIGAHKKVALKFMESQEEYHLETSVRDNIFDYHRNQEIISRDAVSAANDLDPDPPNLSDVDLTSKDHDTMMQLKAGFLLKNARSGFMKGSKWTKRFFVPHGLNIIYYKDASEAEADAKEIKLPQGCKAITEDRNQKLEFHFPFRVECPSGEVLISLAAKTEPERDLWIQWVQRFRYISQAPASAPVKSDSHHIETAAPTVTDKLHFGGSFEESAIVGIRATTLSSASPENEPELGKKPASLLSASVGQVKSIEHGHHAYVISVKYSSEMTTISKRYAEFKDLCAKCKDEIPSVDKFFAANLSIADKDTKRELRRQSMDKFLCTVLTRVTISMELQKEVLSFLGLPLNTQLFSGSERCAGWLFKNARKGLLKGSNWTKRLFHWEKSTLTLRYCKDTDTDEIFAKRIHLNPGSRCISVHTDKQISDKLEYNFFFRIESGSDAKCVELCARSEQDRAMWISEIDKACGNDSFSMKVCSLSLYVFLQPQTCLCRVKLNRWCLSIVHIVP